MMTRLLSLGATRAPGALAVWMALGCGGNAEGGLAEPLVLQDGIPAFEAELAGSLSVDLSYRKAETGAAVVSLWPVVTEGGSCPLDCARQVGVCPPGCDALTIGTNEAASWPGTNTVRLSELPPGAFLLSAYLMRGADHRDGPRQLDPVSRDAPLRVEIVSAQLTHASLSLDALRATGPVLENVRCPLPNAGAASRRYEVGDLGAAQEASERSCPAR